jgi:hypothetical protein
MKIVGGNTMRDVRHTVMYISQVDFNAPLSVSSSNVSGTYVDTGHIALEKGDFVLLIEKECFCFENNGGPSLIKVNMTEEFMEMNSPNLFKVTSFQIKPS